MYSSYTETTGMMSTIMQNNYMTFSYCNHPNSPNYMHIVDNNECCRLFENERLYFLRQDRKNKLENLNDNSRFEEF